MFRILRSFNGVIKILRDVVIKIIFKKYFYYSFFSFQSRISSKFIVIWTSGSRFLSSISGFWNFFSP